jgi:hypothetical protein
MPTLASASPGRSRRRSPAIGEWEVRGDARIETRFHFRTGITSVVPWLFVSASRSGPMGGGQSSLQDLR